MRAGARCAAPAVRRRTRGGLLAAASAALIAAGGWLGCAPEAAPPAAPAVVHVVYGTAALPWLPMAPTARIGRGVAFERLTPLAVRGAAPDEPLRAAMIWQVPTAPGAPSLAAVAGSDGQGPAVELIDVDGGMVRWRVREPAGPIVGVTAAVIVGAGGGTWALDLEGEALWQTESEFAAMAGEAVAVAGSMEQVTVLAAASGRELWRAVLPPQLVASDVRWPCPGAPGQPGGRDLLLLDDRGSLHRVVELESEGGGAGRTRVAWTAAETYAHAEGCGGDVLAATPGDALGTYALALLDRHSGEVKARLAGVRGHWPDGDGLVVVGVGGARRYDAALRPGKLLTAAALGARLASQGDRALVRAEGGLAIVRPAPDGSLLVQRLAATADSAALGERAVATSLWSRSSDHEVRRSGLPAASAGGAPADRASGNQGRRSGRSLPSPMLASLGVSRAPAPALPPALLVDATELGEVRATAPTPLELAAPAEPGLVVAAGAGVAAVLRTDAGPQLVRHLLDGAPPWRAPRGCRGERIFGLVASAEEGAGSQHAGRILCLGGGTAGPSTLVASALSTGAELWARELLAEELQLDGDLALVRSADRATVLRAADGAAVASWRSDDGDRVRAALITAGGAALVVASEGGAVVARWPLAGMIPIWSVAVDGAVTELLADGDRVLVALAGGEAYSLRGADGAAVPIAGEAERWLPSGDGILGLSAQPDFFRLALYARDGALRWARDLSLPGPIEVRASAQRGASALLYGEARDRALPFGERGLGAPLALPESAATAIWVRLLTSPPAAPRWVGVSTSGARWWAL